MHSFRPWVTTKASMQQNSYSFESEVWLWPGEAAWHFVSLPQDISAEIKHAFQGLTRGWGSLPVEVHVGRTAWKTSIFPDRKSGCYMLPVKAAVRNIEGLQTGDSITVSVTVLP